MCNHKMVKWWCMEWAWVRSGIGMIMDTVRHAYAVTSSVCLLGEV